MSTPAGGNTRMMEQQNLSVSCAKPEAGLPESKCSHSLCPPHLLRRARPNDGTAESVSSAREAFLYPNDRIAKSVSFAREAGSRPVREHMPAHICPSRANLLPTLSPIIPQ